MTKKQQQVLRQMAATRAATARRETFRMRAREFGVINARTRPLIEAEAEQAARQAANAVYLTAGYRPCVGECGRLASPQFRYCPACASTSINHPQLKLGLES